MKVILERKSFHAALSCVCRAISGRSSLPALANVLLQPEEYAILLRATDLELGIECRTDARVEANSALCVAAKPLQELVASLPDGELCIESDPQFGAVISSRRSRYRIHGLPPEEFPPLPAVTDAFRFDVMLGTLHDLIRRTIGTVSPDETRPILTGVLWELEPDSLALVSTDTHRLSLCRVPLAHAGVSEHRVVPGRAMREVLRLLKPGSDAPTTVEFGVNEMRVTADGTSLVARLLDGTFPNYRRVIPQTHTTRLTIDAQELAAAVKRAEIVARDDADRVTLRAEEDRLFLGAAAGDLGLASEELEVKREGEEIAITLNAKYLLTALNAAGTDMVRLEATEPRAPAVLRAVGDESFMGVVMPMKARDE